MYFFNYLFLFLLVSYAKCIRFDNTLGHIQTKTSDEIQTKAVMDLIKRIIPDDANKFVIETDSTFKLDGKEVFQVTSLQNDTIYIRGTTGVVAATGFNYYLKYFCKCHLGWQVSQMNIPQVLPNVNITQSLNDRFRYYQNVCTTSYSFVWWAWEQWEKHIDWMALNSFNFVLAFNGQEAIWDRVYKKLNLSQSDIDEHFTGPAFLSWLRMGNMRGFGGPLSSAWHDRSVQLQKKILERMRSLGIIPILPAFAGHLPRGFRRLYPNANMIKMEVWNGFDDDYCCPYFLEPTEPLFNEIGQLFLKEQTAEFGTDHVYNCDSFNEMSPPKSDLSYLANVGKNIYKAMTDVDPRAIWVMQGWLFYNDAFWQNTTCVKSFVTSVPTGKMIILDLQSEQFPQYDRLQQYFGQPYIWCMLHDFGGTLGMFGSSTVLNYVPNLARNEANSTMIGTGLTPEGINQNYVIYDLMTEMAWRNESVNLTEWFQDYAVRRYGKADQNSQKAWSILQKSVYDFNWLTRMRGQYAITKTPSLKINTWIWYDINDLLEAWNYLLEATDNLGKSSGYLHDLVDVTRQVLQVHGDSLYKEIVLAYKNKDPLLLNDIARLYLDLFDDLEAILATNEAFLLGPWIQAAKAAANDSKEIMQFEYNAKNQITLWGPKGEIINYAIKQWSGVVEDFLKPRWSLFLDYLKDCLVNDKSFNSSYINSKMFIEVEEAFTNDRTLYPVKPSGDTIEVAKMIHQKWWPTLGKTPSGRRRDFKHKLKPALYLHASVFRFK